LEGLTFNSGMLALRVPWALFVQSLLESLLRVEGSLSLGGLCPCFWLALPSCTQVVEGNMIVGGAIGLHLVALLLPGDDDVAGVPVGVDGSAEVTRRGVVVVALPLLVLLDYAVPAFGALCVIKPAAFVSHAVFVCLLRGVNGVESKFGRPACVAVRRCRGVRDVVVVVKVVVIELDPIQSIRFREWDFFNESHKDFAVRRGAFGDPPLFFVGGIEGPAFLKR
jgi:hypothetical protein